MDTHKGIATGKAGDVWTLENGAIAVSIREACRISGLGRSTLYKAKALGELPFLKVFARTLILLGDLRRFLKSKRSRRPNSLAA